ncbi:kinase-like domain-containing protein [Nemania serpens]|nr:kinase-like domain-containing protein [Nemania serpens]
MASYNPVPLPYFAPAHTLPAPLPTLEEALSSTDILNPRDIPNPSRNGREQTRPYVARVGEHFVVKYGKAVSSIEGETMLFVKQHTTIPVPGVYAIYTYDEDKTMIIMEFIDGLLLSDFKFMLDPELTPPIMAQLRTQVNQLRQIPAPAYYGTLGHRPFTNYRTGRKYGPFDSFADQVDAAFDKMFPTDGFEHLVDVKRFFRFTFYSIAIELGHSHPVFSHSYIHEKNIIVRSDGTPVLIDYQLAGFYPAYHEYVVTGVIKHSQPFLDEEFPQEDEILDTAIQALRKADHDHWVAQIKEKNALKTDGDSQDAD